MYGDNMMMINKKIKKKNIQKIFFSKTIVLVYIYICMNVFYSIDNCFLYNIIIRYIYLSDDDATISLQYSFFSINR